MYFEWKDSYKVNVTEIDKQHKRLFEIGEKISELVMLKNEYDHYDEIMEILEELKDYTLYHFDFEEKLMEQYGFADLETHKIEHIFMVKKLQRLQRKDIDANQSQATIDLVAFVSDWITSHILKTDMKYRVFFNDKGVV
jgi:hemerythrin-like metal-binding domain